MKNLLFLFLLFLVACNKNGDKPVPYWGEVSALKNGSCWRADIFAANNKPYYQGIDILIDKFNEVGFLREHIIIYKIPMKVGFFALDSTEVRDIDTLVGSKYFTSLDDGDVLGDSYDLLLDDSIPDFVEITEISGKEIAGNFQMSFVKDLTHGEGDPAAPDTIVFLSGKFYTRLKD